MNNAAAEEEEKSSESCAGQVLLSLCGLPAASSSAAFPSIFPKRIISTTGTFEKAQNTKLQS
jgi:hypothetical protein